MLLLFSCKKNDEGKSIIKKDIETTTVLVDTIETKLGETKLVNEKKESKSLLADEEQLSLISDFYNKVINKPFVSTSEFVQLFGSIYNEGENFLKKKNSDIDCFDISENCESYIFSKMKKKSSQVTFSYSNDEIQRLIQNSGNELLKKDRYYLLFPDDNVVKFYFSKDKKLNKKIINGIVVNSNGYFLAEFEE